MRKSFDIRAKILLTVLLTVTIFFVHSLQMLFTLSFSTLLLAIFILGFEETKNSLKLIIGMIIIMIILSPLQDRGGEALILIKDFVLITKEGFLRTHELINRFFFISFSFTLLSKTSNENEFILALRSVKAPYSVCLILTMALRFIPTITNTFNTVTNAQKLRIREKDNRFKKLLPTVIAVLVICLKSVNYTAAALELRGYGRKIPRTYSKSLKPFRKVWTQSIISIMLPLIILTIEVLICQK